LKINHIALFICFLTLSLFANSSFGQSKFTINGFVRDAETGEELIGVTVYIPELKAGTVTNAYGFYSLTLPPATYDIRYSYVGYASQNVTIELTENSIRDIELLEELETMAELVISDRAIDANVTDVSIGIERIDVKALKTMPSLFGEPDLIKLVQMMPGVITAGEGTSSYYVRGGSADQNLILIDEAPIYDPSHLFGYISVFNADVIKSSQLYKGGIPAQFGGRLSSILDVQTINGNNKKLSGSVGIGTLASKIMLEGPIKKEVSSFLVSARRSYADLFLAIAGNENRVYFYDVNAKFSTKIGEKDRIFVAGYFGRDAFKLGGNFIFDWGNATGTFRWNHLFSQKLFSNTTLIASRFDYGLELEDPATGFRWTSLIDEYSFKQSFNWFISPYNELEFGYHGTYRRFRPGKISPTAESSVFSEVELQKLYALDHALYVGNRLTPSSKFSIEYGLRLSIFQNVGPGEVKTYEDITDNIDPTVIDTQSYDNLENIVTYVNLEPRISARYLLNNVSSIKVSYNRMVQNVHLISSGTVPLPFNTWNPSSPYLKPQIADQVAAGYFRNFSDNLFEVSGEAFYKNMQNVTDFADNANIFFNEDLATEFRQGTSVAYGLEFQLKKTRGDFTGFINYTLSKVERNIPGVNLDRTFNANFDRRHAFNFVGAYALSDRWLFNASFTFSSGRPITLPTGRYEVQDFRPVYISERNGYKLPSYNRADVSVVLTPLKNEGRRVQTKWVFGLYNIYNRKNAFTIFPQQVEIDDVVQDEQEFVMIYLFPIVPSVTFNLSF
jgi:hypothetical protein